MTYDTIRVPTTWNGPLRQTGGVTLTNIPESLRPQPGERGVLELGLDELATRCTDGWDRFLHAAQTADPEALTRSGDKTARELCIEAGDWEDSHGLPEMRADAAAGRTEVEPYKELARRLRQVHADAPPEEVVAAVRRARDQVEEWFSSGRAADEYLQPTPSVLGILPMGTVVHAAMFQIASLMRELTPTGATQSIELENLGIEALVDSTGAVAARVGATASISSISPGLRVGTGAHAGAWRTRPLAPDLPVGPGVEGPTGVIIDVASGRVEFLKVARSLRLHQPRKLMAVSVILDDLPDLPGGPLLKRGAKAARLMSFR